MRLLSCRIENFGKLHDMQVDFSEGLNILCRENGWGKSTFAAFLKAMLYGFAETTSRDIGKNERLKYMPWQGGVYGGKIVFTADGKTYELTRQFGAKEKADIFELRDAATNLVSLDFDERLGERLFGIDRDSFARTLFIGQHDCETAVTDNINAGIGRLSANTDDLNNYDDATERLEAVIRAISPAYKKGSANRRAFEITALQGRVRGESLLQEEYERCSAYLRACETEYRVLTERRSFLLAQRDKAAAYEVLYNKRQQWDRLNRRAAEKREIWEGCLTELPEKLPDMEQIDECLSLLEEVKLAEERSRFTALTEEEASSLPELSEWFSEGDPHTEKMSALWNKRLTKAAGLSSGEMYARALEERCAKAEKEAKAVPPGCLIGGVLLVIGVVIAAVWSMLPGFVIGVIGAGLTAVSLIMRSRRGEPETFAELLQLKEDLERDRETVAHTDDTMAAYLEKYGYTFCEEENQYYLQSIAASYNEYCRLLKKEQTAQASKKQYETCRQELLSAAEKAQIAQEFLATEQLKNLRDRLDDCLDAEREKEEALKELLDFEKENGADCRVLPEKAESFPTAEEFRIQLEQLEDELEECRKDRITYRDSLDSLQERRDELAEAKEQLESLQEEQQTELKKYELAGKAKEYLSRAKEAMTAKYADPILRSFTTYYESISGQPADRYRMDANVQITLEEQGLQRGTNTLSAGMRDLVGICLRAALADAVCGGKPALMILDDPFTDLDDGKVEGAFSLLEELAKRYQILYFTCSDSRSGR